jgi:hypothetical protein
MVEGGALMAGMVMLLPDFAVQHPLSVDIFSRRQVAT